MVKEDDIKQLVSHISDQTREQNTRGDYVFSYMLGKKFCRIVKEYCGQKSAYCFVDMGNGNILKAAGWNQRATGVRGNIFNLDNFVFDLHGACFYRS